MSISSNTQNDTEWFGGFSCNSNMTCKKASCHFFAGRLEDLVTRNTQQAVELNHWKKMCEEYSEESDRLEIECDVWRTKFLASR